MPQRAVRIAGLFALTLGVVGCGDAPTSDHRGFTKAPLEVLTVFIRSEQPSEYRAFARFNLPDGQPISLPAPADSAGG